MRDYSDIETLRKEIDAMTIADLRVTARAFGIIPRNYKRGELIQKILYVFAENPEPERPKRAGRPAKCPPVRLVDDGEPIGVDNVTSSYPREGILETYPEGYGFVRTYNYSATPGKDYYMSASMIAGLNVSSGDKLKVLLHQYPDKNAPTVVYVKEINDDSCKKLVRTSFDALEACFPDERIVLGGDRKDYALRALDLVAPLGKGQRGLIVAPPKTGKTILLKQIAAAVRKNHPEIHLTVLLIDERPEEVTDFKENLDCEVVCSTFDQPPENHARIAELVFNNARRRVEQGQHVMILLDSITRLSRAYNQLMAVQGRTLSGGLDVNALKEPKRMFGSGRNVRNGGSLTILATALIETGSRMDDIIYEEFKGTGNMEIHLDRELSERRIFPAIDLQRSSTRREDLLFTKDQYEGMSITRRMLSSKDRVRATEDLLSVIMTTANNDETVEMLKLLACSETNKRTTK